ncbi:MAG: DUF2244 domain-containing protein [Alphaproteobacteria bacterium]|nr:DUF2244 domain-containing protein [Alphaproteobacteria bacterium]
MNTPNRPGNDPSGEPTLFSAIITPHRSLPRAGFLVVMALVGGINFIGGLMFFVIGAWPIVGFLGLDVLLVYWAFRANYRAAAAFEEVVVTPSELRVRNVTHRGKVTEWTSNPLWTRLDRETHEEYGLLRLNLVSHGRKRPIAGFLAPSERESFAAALSAALGEARRGPVRSTA